MSHPSERLKMMMWEKNPVPTVHARWPLPMGIPMRVLLERLNGRLNALLPEDVLAWTAVDGREGIAAVELRGVEPDDPLVALVMGPLASLHLDDEAWERQLR